ncbi:PREDICTED: uncharacterized protein LOC109336135 isoform X1 [Lupinus angustifolius]|uniref:uncharacterized protein LOC109336135 isoform X1 n=1 Tax=Lupinus angustifolius TaxID=3871 RepID=UPI00092EABD1|nr:PREDICTED: uncharacterized protein LOC109336135 isoform X1 [Lupinus angustifolius]
MDPREFHLQPMGICYKLYHFIRKTLASQALKTVTLGGPPHSSSSSTATRDSEDYGNKELLPTHGNFLSSLAAQAEKKNNAFMNIDEIATKNMTCLSQAKPPKKTVSINDNVEEIAPFNKKKRRSKSFQKSSSLNQNEEEEPKPLRSILKVGSDLNS